MEKKPDKVEVAYERSDNGTATITLNRPEVLNAINLKMRAALKDSVRQAEGDSSVRCIVFRGAGDRAFSVGADITEFVRPESLVTARREREDPTWNDLIAISSKPTIASITGYCLGGGLELALACDLRVAATNAIFGLPEVRLGIIPGAGGTQRLPRVVGQTEALRLILTGDRIDANEARRIGLVTEVVSLDSLEDFTSALVGKLLMGAPKAVAYAKEAIRRGSEFPLSDGLRLEADLATILMTTEDRLEGAAAFRERRPAHFTGH